MDHTLQQPNYKTVTLKLWNHRILMSESFVKLTILDKYLKENKDLSYLVSSDNNIEEIIIINRILKFFSECYECLITDHVKTLCDILLFENNKSVLLSVWISSKNINTFFNLYNELFMYEYRRVIFETYEELLRFVEIVRNWFLQKHNLYTGNSPNHTTYTTYTPLGNIRNNLFHFVIKEDKLSEIRHHIRQCKWLLCLNNITLSPLITSKYETMRLLS